MSVPVTKRSENKLEVALRANELCIYTLQITTNEKVFLPQYYNALTSKLQNFAMNIYNNVWQANNIRVTNKNEFNERRRLQTEAIKNCNSLLSFIGIAHKLFHLKGKRMEYWSGLIYNTRDLISKWRESDNKRYKDVE